MSVTVQTIRDRLPEFCKLDNTVIQRAITTAETYINRTQWGEIKADEGTIYLAGHFLVFSARGNGMASGPVTSEREGQLGASYGVSDAAQQSAYGSTSYGRQYLQIQSTIFVTRFESC